MKIKDTENQYLDIKPFCEDCCPECGQQEVLFYIDQWSKQLCEDCLEIEALQYHYIIEK